MSGMVQPRSGSRQRARGATAAGLLLLTWIASALVPTACQCSSAGVVARLEQAQGAVEGEFAPATEFHAVERGAEFRFGDAVRTGASASALLGLSDGSRVSLRETTLLRFSATPGGSSQPALDVETGLAELEVGSSELHLYTRVGEAVLESGTRLEMAPRPTGTRFVVLVGTAHFQTLSGLRDVAASEALEIAIGGAVIEPPASGAERVQAPAGKPENGAPRSIAAVIHGAAARASTALAPTWRALAPGAAALDPGALLELGDGTRAELSNGAARVTLTGAGSFSVPATAAAFVQAERGHVFVRSGAEPIAVAVPGGTLLVLPESRADLYIGLDRTAKLNLEAGKAEVHTAAETQLIAAGERAVLSLAGRLRVEGRSLDYADLRVAAGSNFVVHDPHPPTAIRFAFDSVCVRGGLVERLSNATRTPLASARGESSATLLFPPGEQRYRIRCQEANGISDKSAASGIATVLRDAGTAALSRVPPMTRIDMDGRSYTVVYQNLLPTIAVRWKDAPRAASYVLSIESGRRTRSLELKEPSHTFGAGQLAEGSHVLHLSAGQAASPATRVLIVFENASPTARILAPRDRGFSKAEPLTISGIAAAGWTVSVGDRKLVLDNQARFSEQLPNVGDDRALPIRFEHPLRGVHYYLRRPTGATP
jgi:hypothetical protein